jgi:chromosomal replication initiator protein
MKLEQYEQLFKSIKELTQQEITDSECLSLINDKLTEFEKVKSQEINFDTIEERVCNYTLIDKVSLHSKTRKRQIVFARQLCHFISRKKTTHSYAEIGFRFGRKDHATAYFSFNTIVGLFEHDSEIKRLYMPLLNHFEITL